jgi:uncharacterized RDD family membrane protein YckC
LSASLSQPSAESLWKQEVNQRLAAHRNRKGQPEAGPLKPVEIRPDASRLAAQAAARVAARYANAPSYSEMQAEEAHIALKAAQVAMRAALDAQAVASEALDGLRADSAIRRSREAEAAQAAAEELASEGRRGFQLPQKASITGEASAVEERPFFETPQTTASASALRSPALPSPPPHVFWEQDLPRRQPEPAAARIVYREEPSEMAIVESWEDSSPALEPWDEEAFAPVEPALPIHANLIEFPRELVAARKARPRLAEGPLATAEPERQLSIFEVDPGILSVQPEAFAPPAAAPAWTTPQWSHLELEEQLLPDDEPQQATAPVLEMASFSRRLLAVVVDGALITSAFLGAAIAAFNRMPQLPPLKVQELGALIGFVLIALVYQMVFSTLADTTPGMKYARVSLCTFNNQSPTRAHRLGRLGALLLSVLPVGLGLAWAIFDENHLCWHDRLSQTYLRKY